MNHQCEPSLISTICRRKRSHARVGLFVASAVALSYCSTSDAFQNTRLYPGAFHSDRSLSTLSVVTDPKIILEMELEDDDIERRALEDLYLLVTSEADGLSGDMVEGLPTQVKNKKTKPKANRRSNVRSGVKVNHELQYEQDRGERAQFKGLTMGLDGRFKRQSLSRKPPMPKSMVPIVSKSSTMPGFASQASTDSQIAYNDGLKLAEGQIGKKFIESETARKKRRELNGAAMYKKSASVPDSLVSFANQIHEIDRITPKEEVILGEKTQEAIRLQKIYDSLELSLEREPTDDEWCAATGKINMEHLSQAIEEGLDAKNKLVTANLRMVQGVVNVYIRNGLRGQYNAGDLMQEGVMALIRAAEKFDPTRGFRFSTYAMYWIRSSIKRGQVLQSRVVPVPQRMYESHKKVKKLNKELAENLGREPSKKELARAAGMSELQLDRCFRAMAQKCYSLDQQISNPLKPMDANGKDTLYELVDYKSEDEDYNSIKQQFLREDLIATVRDNLSEEEADLLLLRYGLLESTDKIGSNAPLTIAEVSALVGYKPDKVRRILNKCLKQMNSVMGEEWVAYERDHAY